MIRIICHIYKDVDYMEPNIMDKEEKKIIDLNEGNKMNIL